jgi:hypothetical protein
MTETHPQSTELSEAGKQQLEAGREAKAQSLKEFAERTKGKPTPTQEENDEAALGKHITEHEADGADPDPHGQANKHMEAGKAGGYQTRQSQAVGSGSGSQSTQHKPQSSGSKPAA